MDQGKSRGEAEHLLETVDRDRAAFVRKYYNKEWPDRHLYDMMLNTRAGYDAVAETILKGIARASEIRTPVH